MSTVIDFPYCDNFDRHQLWDRFARADLFEPSLDLPAQGVAQRQAAKQLQVPRTTLQAWQSWHDTLDICPHVAQFFQSGPGLAFLHRLVLAVHLICVEVGACGIRLVCLLLNLPGLDRFVAASYTYCISSNNSAIVLPHQWLPTSIQYGEAMAWRQKEEGRVGSASPGMVRRWGRFFSRVRPRVSQIARGDLIGAPSRSQPWASAVTRPHRCNRLRARQMAYGICFASPCCVATCTVNYCAACGSP
jgi:hypothetical protein